MMVVKAGGLLSSIQGKIKNDILKSLFDQVNHDSSDYEFK